jgi:Asp-tRNA(Asn)/Glu-tRNA(Gln) amidotransferase A subunit family amidase
MPGQDPRAPTAGGRPAGDAIGRPTGERLDGLRLGVPEELTGEGIEPGVRAAFEETLRLAEEKVSGENLVRKALAGGMSTTEAFKKFGIL